MAKSDSKIQASHQKDFDLRKFWDKLWRLLAPVKKQIYKLLILIMFLEAFLLIGPYLLKIIIDLVANIDSGKIGLIMLLIGLMFVANQVDSLINYFKDKKIFDIFVSTEQFLANDAHKTMMYLDLNFHEKENTGNKISKVQRGVDNITFLLGNFFWDVAPTIFQLLFTTIVLFIVDWRFGVIILSFLPIFFYLTLSLNKKNYPIRKEAFDKQEEASGLMAQSIININTVKSFVQEGREASRYRTITEKIKQKFLLQFRKIIAYNIARNFVIDFGRGLLLVFGVYLVWKGGITIGSLVFVYTISEKALFSTYRISRIYDRIMESGEAVERLFDLSQEKSEVVNPPNGIKPRTISGEIELQNTSFVYKESNVKALDNVCAKINSGCVTALVGPSGGGKTTLARMVYRHYDPTSGKVLLDGKDLTKYDIYAFRKYIAIVPQEVEIFNTSVKNNIAYAKPNASTSEIEAAARISNAEEFIKQLSDGYETLVGERGIKLSGGQRQRIGIARAILANPRILIFDEATSNLDSQSEHLIQKAMDKIIKNRTVIIIAHRLSTIKKADKIIVLEKGKVVEQGSHFELSRTNGGLYQKLLKLQAVGDVE